MKKYTIPFIENCPVPVIKFEMKDGRNVYAMIDSGCSASLVSDRFETDFPDSVLKKVEKGKGCFSGFRAKAEMDLVRLLVALPGISDSGEAGEVKVAGYRDNLSTLREDLMKQIGIDEDVHLVLGSDMLTILGGRLDMKKRTVTLYIKKYKKHKANKAA